MSEIKDTAIILSKNNYKEKDLILSIITKKHGRLNVCARGARASTKRFFGGIDIFDCADIVIKSYKASSNLESFNQIEKWEKLSKDHKLFCIASTCLEVTTHLTDEQDEQAKDLFNLLFLTLRALNKSNSYEQQQSILIFFLISTLEKTGFGFPESNTWITAMKEQNCPILPTDLGLIKPTLRVSIQFIQQITNRKINSLIC